MTNRMTAAAIALLAIAFVPACRTAVVTPSPTAASEPAGHELLNATVWFQTSTEAWALQRQVFVSAAEALDRALADPTWTAADEQTGDFGSLPPAIIVDVDETVLDNSALEARFIRNGSHFTDAIWAAWVEERKAEAIPGAVEFVRLAEQKGVTTFYVTNRKADEEVATRDNLKQVGFPVDERFDVVMTRGENGAPSDKASRRALVARTHRVLLMLGDDLGDFTSKEGSVEERLRRARASETRWGRSWFVLPNPMYGSWERALEAGPSGDGPLARKVDALDQRLD